MGTLDSLSPHRLIVNARFAFLSSSSEGKKRLKDRGEDPLLTPHVKEDEAKEAEILGQESTRSE